MQSVGTVLTDFLNIIFSSKNRLFIKEVYNNKSNLDNSSFKSLSSHNSINLLPDTSYCYHIIFYGHSYDFYQLTQTHYDLIARQINQIRLDRNRTFDAGAINEKRKTKQKTQNTKVTYKMCARYDTQKLHCASVSKARTGKIPP